MRLESHVTRETTFKHQPMAWLSAEQNGAARPGHWIHGSGMTCQTTVWWNQTQWQLNHKNSRTQSESFDVNGSILEKVAQEWENKHFWGIARSKKVTVWSRNLLSYPYFVPRFFSSHAGTDRIDNSIWPIHLHGYFDANVWVLGFWGLPQARCFLVKGKTYHDFQNNHLNWMWIQYVNFFGTCHGNRIEAAYPQGTVPGRACCKLTKPLLNRSEHLCNNIRRYMCQMNGFETVDIVLTWLRGGEQRTSGEQWWRIILIVLKL